MRKNPSCLLFALPALFGGAGAACAMQITGFTPAVHNRFASGFPAAPVRNGHPDFVGKDHDWTGVGWGAFYKRSGFGFLSPRHHLTARHFIDPEQRMVHGNDDIVHAMAHLQSVPLGFGYDPPSDPPDLAVTRLATAVPVSAAMPRHSVLDLNPSSTTNAPANYVGRDVFLYGHGGQTVLASPRIAKTTISSVTVSGVEHWFTTPRTLAQLEFLDSGSPAFLEWTDPDGNTALALMGNHSSIDAVSNYHNFTGSHEVMAAINAVMTPDGYALRVVGEPSHTWVGLLDTTIGDPLSWGLNPLDPVPEDLFVTFDGDTAGNGRAVVVAAAHNLRGLYFKHTGDPALGFDFSGAATLTLGRGGIANLDVARQQFDAPLALGAPQYWDAGAGGVEVGTLGNQGYLLSIRSPGPSVIAGAITGAGGIALEGGQLQLTAVSSFTGKTWAHHGTLRVDGDISTSERVVAGAGSVITGHGKLPVVESAGMIMPDGILTAPSLAPTAATRFEFRLGAAAPDYADADGSPNDVLRLTAASPLSTSLGAGNTIAVFLTDLPPAAGIALDGGFFFDNPAASVALLENATIQLHVADPGGPVEHRGQSYAPLARDVEVTLAAVAAGFPGGDVDGVVLRLVIAPEPGTYFAWAATAFPESTPEVDRAPEAAPAGDGIPNLLSYAMALDPLGAKFHLMPTATPGVGVLAFRFRRNLDADDLEIVIESSDDLDEWTPAAPAPIVIDPDVDGDGAAELLEIPIPLAPGEPRRFSRLAARLSG